MQKQIIYTNKDNQDFEVLTNKNTITGKNNISIEIIGGNNCLYFLDKKEVHEFCEILMNEAEIAFPENS